MKNLLILILVLSATSCQFFETEKIPAETFYEEDLKSINWKDVDQYPSFPGCESLLEKEPRKHCFENALSTHLATSIGHENMTAQGKIHDTVLLDFSISRTGKITIVNIEIDSLTRTSLPLLENWLLQSIDSLSGVLPATKRGIPVKTEFTLPIVIKTEE